MASHRNFPLTEERESPRRGSVTGSDPLGTDRDGPFALFWFPHPGVESAPFRLPSCKTMGLKTATREISSWFRRKACYRGLLARNEFLTGAPERLLAKVGR